MAFNKIHRLGRKGEDFAVKYLKRNNYKIIYRNFKSHYGEIDIIAKHKDNIVFFEVKTRTNKNPEYLLNCINEDKKWHIRNTAEYFISKHKLKDHKYRIDVLLIIHENGNYHIEHLADEL